ncbi:minor capsid protein [Bacillus cereus]|uniref:minor capsid protein n=1 Tax=Bacillus cereus TaxID=1396 RepID=UPI0035C9839D
MRVAEVIEYVKSLVPHTYYAYSFPVNGKDESAVVIVDGGMPTEETGVRRPAVQVLVRGKADDVGGAEKVADEIYEALKFKRDFMIGGTSVVEMFAAQSAPLWTGKDEAKRPIFSLNFQLTTRN